jgi:hypothetical protein
MSRLIRELIEIPERVHKGDFVLRLTEGIDDEQKTLRSYVVTEQLARAFDDAIGFIRGAVDEGSSKACYLHGSFGSGKSHFMAVLDLLLQGNTMARQSQGLESVVSHHDSFLGERKFLLVPYHMIGASSFEEGLLGGYVDHVRRKHPDAPLPGVYLAEGLFEDAGAHRRQLGDEAFFAKLNEGKGEGSGKWGKLEAGRWNEASLNEAMAAPAKDERRGRLVADLVRTFFKSYGAVARGGGEGFVGIDDGLSLISKHAQSLGYDAVILFLDELVLWLASRMADLNFVHGEGQKLSKLVEASNPDRPVPLISFVARQRDLRDLVGEHVPGAEKLSFADTLKWWEGRFHTITLEDRNLPVIAERRVLRPRSDEAKGEIDAAFERSARMREEVLGTLLGREGDREEFRRVYPFSPALVQTLVALSSVLQRERTALRIMLMLLVEQRDRLTLGEIVPVGDLYDIIAEGDEPFSEEMRRHFEAAKKLYRLKLEPMLENLHGVTVASMRAGEASEDKARALRNDGRILKTLILATLAPEAEALKDLTPKRLAALNHGTIQSPIPGKEATLLLNKLKQWAAQIGELKIGDEDSANPIISLQITGVDTDAILENADKVDSASNRIALAKELIFREMNIDNEDSLIHEHEWLWHGTKRAVEVRFANIREIADDAAMRPDGDGWKIIIDFPFDPENHGPRDDVARVQAYRERNPATRTVCWIPSHFSRSVVTELGKLVRIKHVLAGDMFELNYAAHLSPTDRNEARRLLEGQRRQLEARMREALLAAYRVTPDAQGLLDGQLDAEDQFCSLDDAFSPRPPAAASLADAFERLLGQMMEHVHPAHPKFLKDVKPADLRKINDVLRPALEAGENRVDNLDKPLREILRAVAEPMGIGQQAEGPFVLSDRWRTHFVKEAGRDQGQALTVGRLRSAIEHPKSLGLPRPCEDLLIMLHAAATRSTFFWHGGPFQAQIGDLPDEVEVREVQLPDAELWSKASGRAAKILGIVAEKKPTPSAVAALETEIGTAVETHRQGANDLLAALRALIGDLGVDASCRRMKTAEAVVDMVESLVDRKDVIDRFARVRIETSEEAMAKCLTTAAPVAAAVAAFKRELVDGIAVLSDERRARAEEIRAALSEAVETDEYAAALRPALRAAENDAVKLLTTSSNTEPGPAPVPQPPAPKPAPGWERVVEKTVSLEDRGAFEDAARQIGQEFEKGDERRVTLTWIVERRKREDR